MRVFAKKTLVALCIFAFLSSGALVYALSSLSWHQNPSVPPQRNFSTNPSITEGSDQTSEWTYDSSTNSFTMLVTLTNNGNTAWTPTITASNVPSGWVFSTSTLSAIPVGDSLAVTLTLHYSSGSPVAGAIGDFTVSIS